MDSDRIEALTQAAAAGDRSALEELLERYIPDLRAYIRLRAGAVVRAHESHSDLVQSVCREVIQHADRFRHPSEGAFRRWLFTTALRKITHRRDYHLAERRDTLRNEPQPRGTDGDNALLERYASFSTPSRAADLREEVARIEHAMDELPEEYREVIAMAKIGGLSRAEIAEEMGKSEGAVRMLLHRALAALAVKLRVPGEDQ